MGLSGCPQQGGVFGITNGRWTESAIHEPPKLLDKDSPVMALAPDQTRCLCTPPSNAPLRVAVHFMQWPSLPMMHQNSTMLLEAVLCGCSLPARLMVAGKEVASTGSNAVAMMLDIASLSLGQQDKGTEHLRAMIEVELSGGQVVNKLQSQLAGMLRLNLWSGKGAEGIPSHLIASEKVLLLPEDSALAAEEVSFCSNDDLLADLAIIVESASLEGCNRLMDQSVLHTITADLQDWAEEGDCTATAVLLRHCERQIAAQFQKAKPDLKSSAALQRITEMQLDEQDARPQAVVQKRSFNAPISVTWAALVILHPLLSVLYNAARYGFSEWRGQSLLAMLYVRAQLSGASIIVTCLHLYYF